MTAIIKSSGLAAQQPPSQAPESPQSEEPKKVLHTRLRALERILGGVIQFQRLPAHVNATSSEAERLIGKSLAHPVTAGKALSWSDTAA